MMVEDLGVEAKEAAVREVAKLLPLPELLSSIASIKSDYITRQQAACFLGCSIEPEIDWSEIDGFLTKRKEDFFRVVTANLVSVEKDGQDILRSTSRDPETSTTHR